MDASSAGQRHAFVGCIHVHRAPQGGALSVPCVHAGVPLRRTIPRLYLRARKFRLEIARPARW